MPFYTTEIEGAGNFTDEELKELNQKIALEHNGFVTYFTLDKYERATISRDIFDFSPNSAGIQSIERFVNLCKSLINSKDHIVPDENGQKKSYLRYDTGINSYRIREGNFNMFFLMYVEGFIRPMFNLVDSDIVLHGDHNNGSFALSLEVWWS